MSDLTEKLLDAALIHVPFDGWGDAALRAAAADCGVDMAAAKAVFPRGGVDMALAYHARGDALMLRALADHDLSHLRIRERIALAVRLRLEAAEDRELVRRGHDAVRAAALMPPMARAQSGARQIRFGPHWVTRPPITTGIPSVQRWPGSIPRRCCSGWAMTARMPQATWEFLDRRIDGVMQVERGEICAAQEPGSEHTLCRAKCGACLHQGAQQPRAPRSAGLYAAHAAGLTRASPSRKLR